MLEIGELQVEVEQKSILNKIELKITKGTIHAIMGPNGSGKSTLALTLAGQPLYHVTNGTIMLNGQDITHASPAKRAQAGLFLAFQQPPAIPGVTVFTFLKEAHHAIKNSVVEVVEFKKMLQKYMEQLKIDTSFMYRNLNDGFSGGERKKFEMLQLLVLQPCIAVLDEIDSGLDIDALQVVAHGIKQAQKENPNLSILIITHYQRILNFIKPDQVHILRDGKIIISGNAQLAQQLEQKGYDAFK